MERVALLAVAAAFFAAYPALDVVYITPDGQSFTQKNKRFGDEHAKAKFGGQLERVTRAELVTETKEEGEPDKSEKLTKKEAKSKTT